MRYVSLNTCAFVLLVVLAACNGTGSSVVNSPMQSRPLATSPSSNPVGLARVASDAAVKGVSPSGATPLYIDAGGGGSGSWIADTDYNGGSEVTVNNAIDTSFVSSPAPQAVYQTQRYATKLIYTIPNLTPNGGYNVRLHFVESYFTRRGQRIFNIKVNGALVLTHFDIFAATGGSNIAIAKPYATNADANGKVTIQLIPTVNDATIAGIEISSSGTPTPTPAPSPTPSPGAYPNAGWVAFNHGPMVSTVASMYGSNPAMVSNSADIINNLWSPNAGDMGPLQMVLGGPTYWKSIFGTGNGQRVTDSFFVASSGDPSYTVSCNVYPTACNSGTVHIPRNAMPSTDSDHHMVIRDLATGLDWQFWDGTIPSGTGGTYVAGTANSQVISTSEGIGIGGTASNIDTAAWSVRPEDVIAGRIPHALTIVATCDVSTNGNQSGAYVYPVVPNPVDGAATDDNNYCGSYNGQYPNNSPSNVNLEYGAHLWLDVPNASIPPVSGSCDAISRAYLRALNEFGAFVSDVGAVGAPIMVLVASDLNDTYNGGTSKWQQVFSQIPGYAYGQGSTFQYNPTSCGINLQQHLHVLVPPRVN